MAFTFRIEDEPIVERRVYKIYQYLMGNDEGKSVRIKILDSLSARKVNTCIGLQPVSQKQ